MGLIKIQLPFWVLVVILLTYTEPQEKYTGSLSQFWHSKADHLGRFKDNVHRIKRLVVSNTKSTIPVSSNKDSQDGNNVKAQENINQPEKNQDMCDGSTDEATDLITDLDEQISSLDNLVDSGENAGTFSLQDQRMAEKYGGSNNSQLIMPVGNGDIIKAILEKDCENELINQARKGDIDKDIVRQICLGSNGWWDRYIKSDRISELDNVLEAFRGTNGPRVRKEYRTMTEEERTRFHRAVRILHDSGDYGRFVSYHLPGVSPSAHFGHAFLPWHREFIYRWENALRWIDPTVAIPFWDGTLERNMGVLDKGTNLFTDDFLGPGEGTVTSGPFAFFKLPFEYQGRSIMWRNYSRGRDAYQSLWPDSLLDSVVNARSSREYSWFVDPALHIYHGNAHRWIGGLAAEQSMSPSDPSFYLIHAFIDCIWETSRQNMHENFGVDIRYDWPNDSLALGVGHLGFNGTHLFRITDNDQSMNTWDKELGPFGMINLDALSLRYARDFTCAPRPTCSKETPHSCGPNLFCDTSKERCVAKIKLGAKCGAFAEYKPCYKGVCCSGICTLRCLS